MILRLVRKSGFALTRLAREEEQESEEWKKNLNSNVSSYVLLEISTGRSWKKTKNLAIKRNSKVVICLNLFDE